MFSHKTKLGTLRTLVINSYPRLHSNPFRPNEKKKRSLNLWLQMMRHQYSYSTDGGTLIFGHTADPKIKVAQMQKSDQSYITKESKKERTKIHTISLSRFLSLFLERKLYSFLFSFLTLTLEKRNNLFVILPASQLIIIVLKIVNKFLHLLQWDVIALCETPWRNVSFWWIYSWTTMMRSSSDHLGLVGKRNRHSEAASASTFLPSFTEFFLACSL